MGGHRVAATVTRQRLEGLRMSKLRSGLTYANVISTLCLFMLLGGGAYAAFKLPNNSVGSKQIKKNAVNSSKVKDRSLLAGDFKAGQLPAGPAGPQGLPGAKGDAGEQGTPGLKGDPCPPSDANCKGPKGDTGQQGPGTISFNTQWGRDSIYHTATTINGLKVEALCSVSPNNNVELILQRDGTDRSMYGWGTQDTNGTLSPATSETSNGELVKFHATSGNNSAQLDVVAFSVAPGETENYTRYSLDVLSAGACNVHGLVIPPS
jgi:hypothetical protein